VLRPEKIVDGVEVFPVRTPTLPPATHTNSYALGEREVVLVEPATPYAEEVAAFVAWARDLKAQGRRLIALFLTHHHIDHVGGAETLARELELPLWAHALTAERLPELQIARRLDEGESIILDGPTPQHWEVLFTPGHAPGHLCLFERTLEQLVVGDMLASEGTILIEPGDGDMRRYLSELERLAGLHAKTALPAHGRPIREPARLFSHYIAHRLMRQEKIVAALAAAGKSGDTPERLLPRVYDDTPQAAWPLGLLSLRAHLVKLVTEGRVEQRDERYVLS
jgi:glyoxylase-like metal-dependent hydrolase (beta-lactamase superfamily II)